jgi:deazaflavin-dependent oxidoreductase (nitroreductase family)
VGWLLGHRFLLLTHVGRRSGKRRQTVLEIVDHDKTENTYTVAAAWGRKSDWFQNVQAKPEVAITIGGRRFVACASTLVVSEAERALEGYSRRHPSAFRALARLMLGEAPADLETACHRVAEQVPLVLFNPLGAEPPSRQSGVAEGSL